MFNDFVFASLAMAWCNSTLMVSHAVSSCVKFLHRHSQPIFSRLGVSVLRGSLLTSRLLLNNSSAIRESGWLFTRTEPSS